MHAAFLVLRERDLSHLSSLQRMGVLVAALSLHAGNVGADDDDLCDSNHELAVLYGHSSPQRQASVAVCFGTAAGKTETDIFSELSAHDARKLRGARVEQGCSLVREAAQALASQRGRSARWRGDVAQRGPATDPFGLPAGYIRDCVMAVSPGSIQQLTNQLKVLGGQLQADEAQAMVDGLQGKDTGLERACISTELAMQCVAVLSSIAHYTEAPDKWARSEHFYVKEQMAFLEKNGQNDPGQQVGRQVIYASAPC